MHTLKYHAVNTTAVIFFSFVCAVTINSVVRFILAPVQFIPSVSSSSGHDSAAQKPPIDINSIVDAGFFKIAVPEAASGPAVSSELSELVLMATMMGPDSVACAMIKKKSDNAPQIFMYKDRWKVDVFGYKLVSIAKTTVRLKSGDKTYVLDMYASPTAVSDQPRGGTDSQGGRQKKTLSKSDLQQKIKNNMDMMLKGLRAGPYMVNGKIDGYKLFIVNPDNYLYEIGARSGDIIKRINGHPIDSTEKLYKIWQTLPQESRILLDLDRGGQTVSYDYTFTE
jgi:general secretion pathway protein C